MHTDVSAVGSAAVESLNTASSLPVLLQGRSNLFSVTQRQSVFFVYSPKKASKCSAYEHQVRKLGREFHMRAFFSVKTCFRLVC